VASSIKPEVYSVSHPREENRATSTGNDRQLGDVWTCDCGDMLRDRLVATRPVFPGMSRICAVWFRVPAGPARGRQISWISRHVCYSSILCLCSLLSSGTTLQYNHEDTVAGISVQFSSQSYKCTVSGGLHITATRLRHNAPYLIQFQKFSGCDTPDARRLGAPRQTPVPDWECEKVAILGQTDRHTRTRSSQYSARL